MRISRKLKGEYRTLLAADSKTNQKLWAVLIVEDDNAWHQEFHLEICGATKEYGSLSRAIRSYESGSILEREQ